MNGVQKRLRKCAGKSQLFVSAEIENIDVLHGESLDAPIRRWRHRGGGGGELRETHA